MLKNLVRKIFRTNENHNLEMFEIPHVDESGIPCGVMISIDRASRIGAIRIYKDVSHEPFSSPSWSVQIEDNGGGYICRTKSFSSLDEAKSVQKELYNFFKSIVEDKAIVIVVRNFNKSAMAA